MKFKQLISAVAVIVILLSCASCGLSDKSSDPDTKAKSYYEYFDTVSVIISYLGDSESDFNANCDAVSELLQKYHRLFDIYYEYSGINNLKTVNDNAGIAPVEVDDELIDFLLYAKDIYNITNGKTNIAMGAVTALWHKAREDAADSPESAYLPSPDDIAEAMKHCDINSLIIDKTGGTVFISDADMRLDVGALGKGYATELAAKLLEERRATSYVLNIGGNIRTVGSKPSGEGWVTGITNPDKSSDESFVTRVVIKDTSLVTSGDYERFYTVGGINYHHIIDPLTGMPARYFSSVSVFAKDSGLADALSTALFCMSYEDGIKLVDKLGDVEVIWVTAEGEVKMTENIEIFS